MKIKSIFDYQPEIEEYFEYCGIDDIDKFFKFNTIGDSTKYPNMDTAIQCFSKNLQLHKNIYILIDTDTDGYISSSLFHIWLRENYPHINIIPIFHNNPKSHGLNDVIDDILQLNPSLLIIPDAGTNDVQECKILKENGFEILVIDHHHIVKENPYATIVNNQMGDVNKQGSGALVVWHFCNAIKPKSVNHLISYVMLSLIGDSMNVANYENATFIKYGKANLHKNLKPLIETFNSKGDTTINKSYSFGVISKMNACIRYGNQEDKENLFKALCGELDIDDEFINRLTEIHQQQNKDKDKLVKLILDRYDNDDNYMIVKLKKSTPLSGLVANTILNKTNKTCFVLTDRKDSFSGSARSKAPLRDMLENSRLTEEVAGHSMAFGVTYLKQNEKQLREFLNQSLASYEPHIEVLCSTNINTLSQSLMADIHKYRALYGQGFQFPLIHIKEFEVNGSDWKQLGAKGNTIKLIKNGIEIIYFNCGIEKRAELLQGRYDIEIIGEMSINEWNGRKKPQIIINDYEISKPF